MPTQDVIVILERLLKRIEDEPFCCASKIKVLIHEEMEKIRKEKEEKI